MTDAPDEITIDLTAPKGPDDQDHVREITRLLRMILRSENEGAVFHHWELAEGTKVTMRKVEVLR